MKKVFEGIVEYDSEDSGQSLNAVINEVGGDANNGMFVRIQSWQDADPKSIDDPIHTEAELLRGKKVRVTVEVID